MLLLKPFISQEMKMMLADVTKEDLTLLADLMQSGKITPVIDKTYPFSEIREAIRYVETGRARGKVVVTLSDDERDLPGRSAMPPGFWQHDSDPFSLSLLHRRSSCRVDRAHHRRASRSIAASGGITRRSGLTGGATTLA